MKALALTIGLAITFICTSPVTVPGMQTTDLIAGPIDVLEHSTPLDEYMSASKRYRAWNRLCMDYARDTGRTCGKIKPPKVQYARMDPNLRGYYDGSDTVYVNRTLRGRQREATTVHEMSHYLDTMLGLNPPMPVQVSDTPNVFKLCVSEQRAWDLTDEYWRDVGYPRKAVDGDWVKWYNHCRQFADKLYPEKWDRPLAPRKQIDIRDWIIWGA